MKKLMYMLFLFPIVVLGQRGLVGEVTNSGDKEGIHVFNKTFHKYTITDSKGGFVIPVRVNDTVVFSAIQYQLKQVVITHDILDNQPLVLFLNLQVNELDAVFIKPKLSGNLLADSQQIKTKNPVTAKTLGLPNAHVVPLSQEKRKLYTATSVTSPLDALINAVSGRTKMLKRAVENAKKEKEENSVLLRFEQIMVADFKIPEDKLYDFLYYASSDELFSQIIKTKSNIIIYDFIKAKSKTYLALQNREE